MSRKVFKQGPRFATWCYTVRVRGEHGCMTTGSPDTVEAQITCYLESDPNRTIDVFYSEQCGYCHGHGRRCTNRRTLTWRPCKACNGEPELFPDTLISSHTLSDVSRVA